ncbi:MAG: ABC transporter ATP-binding protein [Methanomassiliicoccaceae archaeon]|nr:ABC transporter ATP-binding protein [Methanomassiliicoccaceae archaeon]
MREDMNNELPLRIRGLSAGYDGNPVFEGLDLDLMHGDFLAIVGPNGGGKTTLFKTILGLIPPISGTVEIFGGSVSAGIVGYVPQSNSIDMKYPISVEDVVLMGLRVKKGLRPYYNKNERDAAHRSMESVGIFDLKDRSISELSGGQFQRAMIARALAPSPKILMLDEPTASLDPGIKDCTHDILRDINRDGVTVMMITHDIGNIPHGVKRIACMNRGMIINDSPEITDEMIRFGFHCPPEFLRFNRKMDYKYRCACPECEEESD